MPPHRLGRAATTRAADFGAVYARRRSGVVSITTSGAAAGRGTGVVIDDDGRTARATVLGTDTSTDLALLQVDAERPGPR